jgi:hypothetical protein
MEHVRMFIIPTFADKKKGAHIGTWASSTAASAMMTYICLNPKPKP